MDDPLQYLYFFCIDWKSKMATNADKVLHKTLNEKYLILFFETTEKIEIKHNLLITSTKYMFVFTGNSRFLGYLMTKINKCGNELFSSKI